MDMQALPAPDNMEHDELDIMHALSPPPMQPLVLSAPIKLTVPAPGDARRSLRPRQSIPSYITGKGEGNFKLPRTLKRKASSSSTVENHPEQEHNLKKTKKEKEKEEKKVTMEDKKALTIVVNARKVSVEAARRRWLYRHRDLFVPLLPASSTFFLNLQKEIESAASEAPVKGGSTEYIPFHELDEQPKLVTGGTLKDYQLHGLSFLVWMWKNGMNCILGDEMGLGKTLQTLSLLAYIAEHSKSTRLDPHLIVCPLSVLPSWLSEAARFVPSFRTLRFHGTHAERARIKEAVKNGEEQYDICVTTYDAYAVEDGWFKSRRWTYCVLDEGHKIKNAETNISSKIQGISAMYRLILTGTPIHNNLYELWSLLHWLYPQVFTASSENMFRNSFDLSKGSYSLPFIKAAQQLLRTIMLRRTKANVEMSVPPREEYTVFVPLTEAQRFWTLRLLTRLDAVDLKQIFTEELSRSAVKTEGRDSELEEGRREVLRHITEQVRGGMTKTGEQNQWKRLMNLLMQLRKVCDHPYLLPDAEPSPIVIGEHLVAASSKLIMIDKLLADVLPRGERVLIFSQWTGMLDILEDFMTLRSIPYARLDGSTTRPRRALDIKLFQQDKSPYSVFLISTKAGGLGINLTKATTVIMCDSDWNPQNDLQAIARAHRIGQTNTVKVYRLICHNTVEDQMLDRIRRKLFLSVKVMGSDNPSNTDASSTLRSSELMDILRKGSSALSTDGGMSLGEFLSAPLSSVLDASRAAEGTRDAKMKHELAPNAEQVDAKALADAEEEERELLSGVAQVQSRIFEGKLIERGKKKNHQIANEWQALQEKAKGKRVIMDGIEIPARTVPAAAPAEPKAKQKGKAKWDSEDWCHYCRDGGELVCCGRCPRVFHKECRGLTAAQLKRNFAIICEQHSCVVCNRSTGDAGGMLFRCQTCPQAFCEDCLPEGDIDAVGETLPEFLLLGYGFSPSAYYIRCHDCRQRFIEEPRIWESWQEEERETQRKLEALRNNEVVRHLL
ncbi:hypothetical protein PUNSTDRAFT_145612 [Punctularia strigosozonata HHB-11173 SS5]|uniref:uncharacterized protein n=1 Tax=Punctularia strigosozonata (strain HHB-11173) TaxID=741275 RepID=UPI00044180E2|nr:uncharacterized protein PUNSTDRAFT_145612 [Punctularia strigosozonata HHB-11173 SS5]EIN05640.1 hypothetical protein PUNSTDRAFT_145612 [Punctularia strigosozonata HHB-11173 SS5]